ncbi:hypothetical protein KEM56_003374, partial [Ascosphaera pollenicola]
MEVCAFSRQAKRTPHGSTLSKYVDNDVKPSVTAMKDCREETSNNLTILQGIAFFASHPYLYPLFRSRLVPVLFISLFIYTILFAFAYLPQVALLAIFHGHAAWVSAVFLVLGEGAALVALLFEAFFVDETLVDVFDAVLIARGEEDLVAPYRTLEAANFQGLDGCTVTRNPVQRLGQPLLAAV